MLTRCCYLAAFTLALRSLRCAFSIGVHAHAALSIGMRLGIGARSASFCVWDLSCDAANSPPRYAVCICCMKTHTMSTRGLAGAARLPQAEAAVNAMLAFEGNASFGVLPLASFPNGHVHSVQRLPQASSLMQPSDESPPHAFMLQSCTGYPAAQH